MICPKDGKPCVDDLCHGGSPVCGAHEMLDHCDECGTVVWESELVYGMCCECRGEDEDDFDSVDEDEDG